MLRVTKYGVEEYFIGENQQQDYTFIFDHNTTQREVVMRFYVEAYATLKLHVLIMCAIAETGSDASMRIKIECVLRGQGAQAFIKGAYVLSEQHSLIIDTFQHHEGAYTQSTLLMKGVLRDQAYVKYQGTIRVEKTASGAYASQENKNIVLSNAARAVSIPNLEVLHNEVKCFHGSAIGGFDPEQLFYVASRGINEKKAEELLLKAFFADVVEGEVYE